MPSLKEQIKPRTNLAPLLLRLEERPPERLDYIGVSYGMTYDLLKLAAFLYNCLLVGDFVFSLIFRQNALRRFALM